jgi:uncharacterized membrane protein
VWTVAQSALPVGEAWRVAQLGVVAGLRSQLPFALLALATRRGEFAADRDAPLGLLRKPASLPVLGLLAGGELVGDKLPMVPSRVSPGPLIGRVAIGAAAGAAVAGEAGRAVGLPAALGGAGAALGSLAGYQFRTKLGRATGLPDAALAVAEDALALGLGVLALRRRRARR